MQHIRQIANGLISPCLLRDHITLQQRSQEFQVLIMRIDVLEFLLPGLCPCGLHSSQTREPEPQHARVFQVKSARIGMFFDPQLCLLQVQNLSKSRSMIVRIQRPGIAPSTDFKSSEVFCTAVRGCLMC